MGGCSARRRRINVKYGKEEGMQIGKKSSDKTEFENPLIRQKIFGHLTKNG